jgi:hypothetical protein
MYMKARYLHELHPGHGLTAKPGSDATSFEEIADLDQMVKNPLKQSATDPDMTSFSNNVGFYRGPFQVLPKGFTAVPAPPGTPAVTLEKVDVSGNKVTPEGSVIASASLRGGAQALFDVQVNFYDGDPAAGGHARHPRFRADDARRRGGLHCWRLGREGRGARGRLASSTLFALARGRP